MGTNNRQHRAAKQRKRRQRGTGRPSGSETGSGPFRDREWDEAAEYGEVELRVSALVARLGAHRHDDEQARRHAEALLRAIRPRPRQVAELVLGEMLDRLGRSVSHGGWGGADLRELVRRQAGEPHLQTLAAVLDEARLRLDSVERLASGLRLAALLSTVPLLDPDSVLRWSAAAPDGGEAHPKLARVRALLAKAESTEYDEEAEALSAKAQELITRYALDQLVRSTTDRRRGDDLQVRRLWLDPPYLRAKATLVHQVATANRCRSASSGRFGFCLVVGSQPDLDAVELLVTSLLVQADRAMLRHGRRLDRAGRSRTRSFRRSFLVAYAIRIGERLQGASEAAVAADSGRLLPVLRDHEVAVTEAFDTMVPHTVARATTITNGEGWAAGVAAADLARLDVNGKLTEPAAG